MTTVIVKSRVVVIGHINHDRIWRLTEPLRAGGRISWTTRETRLGGGGYFTARRLLELGHPVTILSNLMQDAHGEQALADLSAAGFDVALIARRSGETDFADILLDPTGERTILSSERRLTRSFKLQNPIEAPAFYVNAPRLPAAIIASLENAEFVVSQLPLRDFEPRPADLMVGSKADLPGEPLAETWARASVLSGPRLRHLVMTDGPEAISVFDGHSEKRVTLGRQVHVRDTIGAGDSFSGALIHALLQGADIISACQAAGNETADWLARREAAETAPGTSESML